MTRYITVILFCLVSRTADAGSMSAGGGGSIRPVNNVDAPVLIDFPDAGFSSSESYDDLETLVFPGSNPLRLSRVREEQALPAAKLLMHEWTKRGSKAAGIVALLLDRLTHVYVTNRPLRDFDEDRELADRWGVQYDVVALFDDYFGPVINVDQWNQLGRQSRIGLYIHESLRVLWNINQHVFTNHQLHSIVSQFVWLRPSAANAASIDAGMPSWLIASADQLPDLETVLAISYEHLANSLENQISSVPMLEERYVTSCNRGHPMSCMLGLSGASCNFVTPTSELWELCYRDGSAIPQYIGGSIEGRIQFGRFMRNLANVVPQPSTGPVGMSTFSSWEELESVAVGAPLPLDRGQKEVDIVTRYFDNRLQAAWDR